MENNFEHPKETGLVDELPVLALDVPDKELIENFKRWENDAKEFWNNPKGYNLETRRKKNERYWKGIQIDEDKLYSYQIPYIQNELFIATETITPVTATFCQTITHHQNVFRSDGRFVHELQETLVVMREISTWSRTNGSGYCIGYK